MLMVMMMMMLMMMMMMMMMMIMLMMMLMMMVMMVMISFSTFRGWDSHISDEHVRALIEQTVDILLKELANVLAVVLQQHRVSSLSQQRLHLARVHLHSTTIITCITRRGIELTASQQRLRVIIITSQ